MTTPTDRFHHMTDLTLNNVKAVAYLMEVPWYYVFHQTMTIGQISHGNTMEWGEEIPIRLGYG